MDTLINEKAKSLFDKAEKLDAYASLEMIREVITEASPGLIGRIEAIVARAREYSNSLVTLRSTIDKKDSEIEKSLIEFIK